MNIYKTYSKIRTNTKGSFVNISDKIHCIKENSFLQKIPLFHCLYIINLKSYKNFILLFIADIFILTIQKWVVGLDFNLTGSETGDIFLNISISGIILLFSLDLSYFIFDFFHTKALKSKKLHLIGINSEFSHKTAIQKSFENIAQNIDCQIK